ncbi:aminotransferase class I and II [Ethanoligenens harbinense YUAN-3]|uniref:Aminotransferase class I and II n=1 Tax=Ethanoligenens harbinense (strain DSM 18485 / JCM 12961 / CGMCC 1.5033 / YUAN-3) TaxID=663278 RepID=E6U997_ETHHY|nr:aminotransferase class I/II-fold pyridoxal phosphate-dependent enzyme [Ethanoligenens harbinense]ADU27256.1 aminotransferase class I and II [Ethanoligenens harbinense YUAN-3]AVQ96322.1 aspartate aminotransferase [Ethanoligenens harbinense YUAN-3]AYF38980.1 aspartate aminotransferase [Ethanoligenens harbinense]AYF41733.1 aspartate aminotransferase [Ethanoligenens harbinense]QCN92563.1 aminotransferase class I/II-fold pyridoxal phosphate-dependent enzyme [Ethanoligenens harbinense]
MNFEFSNFYKRLPFQFFGALQNKVAAYQSNGIDIIDLSIGNPDLPTPGHIVQRLKESTDDPDNHRYQPFTGKPSTLEAVAAFYRREYGVELDPQTEVAIFQGSCIGILAIPKVLLNPGDFLLTTDPCYPAYHTAAVFAGASHYRIPVYEKDGFLPNYTAVPQNVLQKIRLLMLNYPNNPTGAVATRDFFARTLDFAAQNRMLVVNDFAYGAFGFDGRKPLSLLQTPGGKEYAVEIYTASKTWNMAGWRFGFAVGNASVIGALKEYHTHAYSAIFGAVQDAAAVAMLGPQDFVGALVSTYERRRDLLMDGLRAIGWDAAAPAGTFYVWLKVPEGYDSVSFSDLLLEKAHVAVAPGEGFGRQGRQYVRIGLTNCEERLLEAISRIAQVGIFGSTEPIAGRGRADGRN